MSKTIKISDELAAKLRERLTDDTAMAEFVQLAVAEKLDRDATVPLTAQNAYELGGHLFGKFGSGREDLSENYEKILREKLRESRRG